MTITNFTVRSCILFCALQMQVFVFAKRLSVFVERKDYRNKISEQGAIPGLPAQATLSPMQCSRLCLKYPDCESYFENDITRECKLISYILTGAELSNTLSSNWHYFAVINTSACRTDKGYVLDTQSHICFKLIQQNKNSTEARAYCEQDGGQLIRIRDAQQQSAIFTYLSTFKLKRNSPTVDGFRDSTGTAWKFADGTGLQYFDWVIEEPLKEKNCVKLHHNVEFRWAAARCSRVNYFICEIPV